MIPNGLDTKSKSSLVVPFNLANEVKEKGNIMEKVIVNVNQRVRKANTAEKTDLDRNRVMTSEPFADALDHHPKETNLKKGVSLVHLRPVLLA